MKSKKKPLFLQKMGSKPFQFKHFSVAHDQCTHKVGTDGVLLGAWVNIHGMEKRMLDIGTGSGLIALMLAQRTQGKVSIDGVDIEARGVRQATENVHRSDWRETISIHHASIQQFHPANPYDLIVSNPPYFIRSLLPPDENRGIARHTAELSHGDLLANAYRLISEDGRLALVLPFAEGMALIDRARTYNLFPLRKATLRSRAHKPPERLLLELARTAGLQEEDEIVMYGANNSWSEQYKRLTRDFYLKC